MKTSTQTAKHTPGPWSVDTRLTGHRFNGEAVRYFSIHHTSQMRDCYIATEIAPTTLITSGGDMPNSEGEANARLIASAPDLLAALQEITAQHDAMLETFKSGFGWGRIVSDKARAAIARATQST
jgi:hypothetical protein